jgi:Peptidase S24-like/Helix-turn-helix
MASSVTTANLIGPRLREAVRKSGLKATQVAKRANVLPTFIYDIVAGKSANPSAEKLMRVAEILDVPLDWLVGVPVNGTSSIRHTVGANVVIPHLAIDDCPSRDAVITLDKNGNSFCFPQNWIEAQLHANPVTLLMMYVNGESMEPTLCHNDLIMVDTACKAPSPPGVFALLDGVALKVRRLEYTHDESPRLRIIADCPCYANSERPINECQIVGRVVWFSRKI